MHRLMDSERSCPVSPHASSNMLLCRVAQTAKSKITGSLGSKVALDEDGVLQIADEALNSKVWSGDMVFIHGFMNIESIQVLNQYTGTSVSTDT